jgi:hypothetical protein
MVYNEITFYVETFDRYEILEHEIRLYQIVSLAKSGKTLLKKKSISNLFFRFKNILP